MGEILDFVTSARFLTWAAVISTIVIWVLIIFGTPVVIRKLPPDFFSNKKHLEPRGRDGRPWPWFILLHLLKNLAGVALVLLGTVGLQGVLVVMMGLAIMDIPKKAEAIRWLAKIPFVWRLMSRIRAKAGLPPFEDF